MAADRTPAPTIDARDEDDVAAQTEGLVEALTGGAWRRARPGEDHDPLGALIKIFAGMAARAIDGVNAVPDAGLAAFLELIGVMPQRPAAARVPLTFALADEAPVDAVVPALTQVGATADEGDKSPDPIVFETEEELVVTRARLVAAVAHAPARDRAEDITATVHGAAAAAAVFEPRTPAEHELLIACPTVLAREGADAISLTLDLDAAPAASFSLKFFRWDGLAWQPLAAQAQADKARVVYTLAKPAPLRGSVVAGTAANWLRALLDTGRIVQGWPGEDAPRVVREAPAIKNLSLGAAFSGANIPAAHVVRDATELVADAEFKPLGDAPAVGTVVAISGGAAFAQPAGTSVVVDVALGAGQQTDATRPVASKDLLLVWEVMTGESAWTEVGRSTASDPCVLPQGGANQHGFVDDTYALTRNGRVRLRLPAGLFEGTVAGKRGRWLRARIVAGDYGTAATTRYDDKAKTFTPVASTLRPPVLAPLKLSYAHALEQVPAALCVARNYGHATPLGPLSGGGAAARPFVNQPPGVAAPFDRPALYLGFDRGFSPRPVDLYLQIEPPDPTRVEPPETMPPTTARPELAWEYLGEGGWTRIGVRDGTGGLRQRGVVRFLGPGDPVFVDMFGKTCQWLRVRHLGGEFRISPRLARVALNTVWAAHATTRRLEVLGSSTGAPGQVMRLLAAPVLAGERVEVRELDAASERDVDALRAAVGDDAVTVERDEAGAVTAAWVRWTPVTHFHGSGAADRHYVLDEQTGEVRFGDGRSGRPPPQGRANVRAAEYRGGGGPRGNRPAAAVSDLRAAVPYVAGVTNLEPATGGTAREDDARVRARGPRRLRHRDRAVSAVDYEDLALEAAPEVARAHALTVGFNPIDVVVDAGAGKLDARGWYGGVEIPQDTAQVSQRAAEVRVVIVPRSDDDQPAPSVGLLEHVEAFLKKRSAAAARVHVSGPRWIRVVVRAAIVPRAGAAADRLVAEVRAAITRYLHPLTGGDTGEGWAFGRVPRRSHLFRKISRCPGVDHVQAVTVITDPPLPDAGESLTEAQRRALAGALIYSGAHDVALVAAEEG